MMKAKEKKYHKIYNKRNERAKKNILLCSFILLLCSTFIIFLSSFSTQASDYNPQGSYKYFKNIEIQKGDTLWSIASEYADEHYKSKRDYINEVKRMNNLSSDHIKSGYYLIIPYYSSELYLTADAE